MFFAMKKSKSYFAKFQPRLNNSSSMVESRFSWTIYHICVIADMKKKLYFCSLKRIMFDRYGKNKEE
mgnify:CR=1 FL=1